MYAIGKMVEQANAIQTHCSNGGEKSDGKKIVITLNGKRNRKAKKKREKNWRRHKKNSFNFVSKMNVTIDISTMHREM